MDTHTEEVSRGQYDNYPTQTSLPSGNEIQIDFNSLRNPFTPKPILITPRQPKGTVSPVNPNPKGEPQPEGALLQPKYFLGTVEGGMEGNFHGYYFPPSHIQNHGSSYLEQDTQRKSPMLKPYQFGHHYHSTLVSNRQANFVEPRVLFPPTRDSMYTLEQCYPTTEGALGDNGNYCQYQSNHWVDRNISFPHRERDNQARYPPRHRDRNSYEKGGYAPHDQDKEYPLSDHEERREQAPPSSHVGPTRTDTNRALYIRHQHAKFEHTSDTDSISDIDEYRLKTIKKSPATSLVNDSSNVGKVLSHVVQQQAEMHQKNLEVMQSLVNRPTNSFILDDVPVFDGLKGSIEFEQWLLELDKAAEITGMMMLQLAFSKSTGTPHKMIKQLCKIKSWLYIKEKLQITHAKLATDVHASTDLNLNRQKRHEPLEDYIERFYQSYKRATNGEDPGQTRNPHIINTFVRNLYNRDIRKRVSGTQLVDLQSAFSTTVKIQQKLKHFEGYEYISDDDDDGRDKVVNLINTGNPEAQTKHTQGPSGATPVGPCYVCGGYGHLGRDCPNKTRNWKNPMGTYVKATNGQYIPLQLLNTSPPTLTQQIMSQGIINLQAWVEIQEKVNALAENNQLIDKQQKTLGRSHQKLKRLTNALHEPSKTPTRQHKSNLKFGTRRLTDKKVKFSNAKPDMPPAVHDGTVNMIQNENEGKSKDTEDVESTPVPNDSPSSSDDKSKCDYFGLLSSSSDEYNSGDQSGDDE